MKPDPNYPRMMFHPRRDPVTVYSEEQETALGREWSRTITVSLPREEKPVKLPEPEPEDEPEEEPEPEEEVSPPVHPRRSPKHPPLRTHGEHPAKSAKKKRG